MGGDGMETATASRTPAWRRFAPLALLLVALGVFVALGGHRLIGLDALRENYADLRAFAETNPWVAALAYVGIYVFAVSISLPSAGFLSIAGGLLFGTWLGGALTVFAATAGATIVFLVARSALGSALAAKAGPTLDRLRAGFNADSFNYLLVLRLVPAFPFWLVNVAAALLGMRLGPYVLGTAVGIIPGTFVYCSVGAGAGAAIEAGGEVPLDGLLLKPDILLPVVGLVALSLLPVAVKRWKRA
jgi:uncharacterized membrane protein YdjX (TVP38/TMEM64 family)